MEGGNQQGQAVIQLHKPGAHVDHEAVIFSHQVGMLGQFIPAQAAVAQRIIDCFLRLKTGHSSLAEHHNRPPLYMKNLGKFAVCQRGSALLVD